MSVHEIMRLGVLFGGQSPEHEISVISARSIMREADPTRFELAPIWITRTGAWLSTDETWARLEQSEIDNTSPSGNEPDGRLIDKPEALATLSEIDVAFPIVHGRNGEDGTLQGLLELAGIPYVGSGVAASAVGMDKGQMRALFGAHKLPQPRYELLREDVLSNLGLDMFSTETLLDLESVIGYPCFVKPANGGSSIGVNRVESREELAEAILAAAQYDRKVLVEEAISGQEIECAILGNTDPKPSPLGEIRPNADFYSYDAKYGENGADLIVPAEIGAQLTEHVQKIAVDAYRALDCSGLARVDFIVRPPSEAYVLEINTLPGFTPISMYPRLWEETGLKYQNLITQLIDLALERHAEVTTYA